MAPAKKCCGSCSLKMGCYISASYSMGIAVLNIALISSEFNKGKYENDGTARTFGIMGLVVQSLFFVTAGIMVMAVMNKKPRLLLPYISICTILTIFLLVDLIRVLAFYYKILLLFPSMIVFIAVDVISFALNVFVLSAAKAYYKAGCETEEEMEDL